MLRTADLEYNLPSDRIATHPAEPRDSARLLVMDRREPASLRDASVRDLPDLLRPGDLLVFNTTRVLPARFMGSRCGTGGQIEGLYLHDLAPDVRSAGGGGGASASSGLVWVCLIKGRHTRVGAEFDLHDTQGGPSGIRLVVIGRPEHEPGAWVARVEVSAALARELGGAGGAGESGDAGDGRVSSGDLLERIGSTPLPPYILKARKDRGETGEAEEDIDRNAYQTVYAQDESHGGSVAAPTAGLHFTPELLDRLRGRGVLRADVVLHVGAGTFKPVDVEYVEEHPIHSEWCTMSGEAVSVIRRVRASGGRVVCVGTTSVRTVESYAPLVEGPASASIDVEPPESVLTRLLITPGYPLRWTDGLLTNFHLPKSTLMALVAAFLPGDAATSVTALKRAYERAIATQYRFYSFGDAMLVI